MDMDGLTGFGRGADALLITLIVVVLAAVGGIGYVLIHFLAKAW